MYVMYMYSHVHVHVHVVLLLLAGWLPASTVTYTGMYMYLVGLHVRVL